MLRGCEMSLVEDLADQIRVAREELPVAQVAAAAERLRMAGGLLAWVRHATSEVRHATSEVRHAPNGPVRLPQLGSASERLDAAARLMRSAQDLLAAYTLALGIAAEPVTASGPVVAAIPSPRTGALLAGWWAERVRHLSGRDDLRSTKDSAGSSTELLRRLASAALANQPTRVHHELAAAGPAVGLGLAAVAPSILRSLASDLVGHPPRLEDLARVRRAGLVHMALLPNLPVEAAEEVVSRACHANAQRSSDKPPTHPVDAAAAAALLVAGLLTATKRDCADLTTVVEEHQRRRTALAAAKTKRPALRIAESGRRRSAIDALGDAPVG
jgi:hypothetical protein